MHECEGLMATPGKDPQIVKDGPLQTLNVLLFNNNIVQFCFCCVDMSVKEKNVKNIGVRDVRSSRFLPKLFLIFSV